MSKTAEEFWNDECEVVDDSDLGNNFINRERFLAAMEEYKQQEDKWIECVAFCQWAGTLGGKVPHPKNENGSSMNYYELFQYWLTCEERNTFLNHAAKYPAFSAPK